MKIISVIRSSLSNQSSPTFCLWHSWVTHAKCPRCPCPLFYACTLCNSMVGWGQNISIMCYWLVQPTWLAPISQARFGWVQKSSVSRVCDGILSNTAVNNLRMVNPFNWSLWYLGQRKEKSSFWDDLSFSASEWGVRKNARSCDGIPNDESLDAGGGKGLFLNESGESALFPATSEYLLIYDT